MTASALLHECFIQAADAADGEETGRAAAEPAVQEQNQGCVNRGDGHFVKQLMELLDSPFLIYEETKLREPAANGLCVKYYDFFCYRGGNE